MARDATFGVTKALVHRRRFLQTTGTLAAAVVAARATRTFADPLLAPGTQATVSADGGWWRVVSDAAVGYVSADYLTATGQASASGIFDIDLDMPYSAQLSPI